MVVVVVVVAFAIVSFSVACCRWQKRRFNGHKLLVSTKQLSRSLPSATRWPHTEADASDFLGDDTTAAKCLIEKRRLTKHNVVERVPTYMHTYTQTHLSTCLHR